MSDTTTLYEKCVHNELLIHEYEAEVEGEWEILVCPGGREIRVDEAMIERAAHYLWTHINEFRPQPTERWNELAAELLRAALEVTEDD